MKEWRKLVYASIFFILISHKLKNGLSDMVSYKDFGHYFITSVFGLVLAYIVGLIPLIIKLLLRVIDALRKTKVPFISTWLLTFKLEHRHVFVAALFMLQVYFMQFIGLNTYCIQIWRISISPWTISISPWTISVSPITWTCFGYCLFFSIYWLAIQDGSIGCLERHIPENNKRRKWSNTIENRESSQVQQTLPK